MQSVTVQNVKRLEDTFKMWLENEHFSPREIMVAFHNTCVHGDALEPCGYNVTEESLKQLFEGFEISLDALKKMS